MDLEKRFRKNISVLSKGFEDEVVLLPIGENIADLGRVYIITGVGIRIWELLDDKRKVGDIKKEIVNEFKVSPRKAEDDLISFLEELRKKKFIKEV